MLYKRELFSGGVKYYCTEADIVITGTYSNPKIEADCVSWHVSRTGEKFHSLEEAKERVEELLV